MTTRRLAAILAADMEGYSRLMGADKATVQGRKAGTATSLRGATRFYQ
jgi:hypothetical protein